MGFILKGDGKTFQPAPAGAFLARCYRIIDLGTQDTTYKGQSKRTRQLMISWELPTELNDEGKPFMLSRKLTASMGENANLRALLKAWRGKDFTQAELDAGFDISILVGKPCMLNVVHTERDGTVYANIGSVMPVPGGMVVPPAVNKPLFLSLDPDEFNVNAFESLSDKLKETIMKSPEYQHLMSNDKKSDKGSVESMDDDIPF